MTNEHEPLVDWAVAARPKPGFEVSGDACCVRSFPEGVLVTVIDGIGHGEEARVASAAVVRVVESLPAAPPLQVLVASCHEAARRTRGAVMSAAWFSRTRPVLEWIGVGNVEGVVRRAVVLASRSPTGAAQRERLLCVGGIVGERLPRLVVRDIPVAPGDVLVLATDGVPGAVLDDAAARGSSAEQVARLLLEQHAIEKDDALVLVARLRRAAESGDRASEGERDAR